MMYSLKLLILALPLLQLGTKHFHRIAVKLGLKPSVNGFFLFNTISWYRKARKTERLRQRYNSFHIAVLRHINCCI